MKVKEEGLRRFRKCDRGISCHISGGSVSHECRQKFMDSCTSPKRTACAWLQDDGMTEYILRNGKNSVVLHDELPYAEGAAAKWGRRDGIRWICSFVRGQGRPTTDAPRRAAFFSYIRRGPGHLRPSLQTRCPFPTTNYQLPTTNG